VPKRDARARNGGGRGSEEGCSRESHSTSAAIHTTEAANRSNQPSSILYPATTNSVTWGSIEPRGRRCDTYLDIFATDVLAGLANTLTRGAVGSPVVTHNSTRKERGVSTAVIALDPNGDIQECHVENMPLGRGITKKSACVLHDNNGKEGGWEQELTVSL
jgi:hypothetical protein